MRRTVGNWWDMRFHPDVSVPEVSQLPIPSGGGTMKVISVFNQCYDEQSNLQELYEFIQRFQQRLGSCAYHLQDHLWRVPLRMAELLPESRFVLYPHGVDGFGLVCYAIPFGGNGESS